MQHPSPSSADMDRSPEPAPPTRRVERWRGYASSTFVLRTATGETVESRPFRWRKSADPPDDGDARRAYDELIDRLTAAGWTQVDGGGDAWFEADLTHPTLATAPDTPEQPPPAPEPAPPAAPVVVAVAEPAQPARTPAVVLRPAPAFTGTRSRPPARRGFVAGVCVGAAAAGILAALVSLAGGHGTSAATTAATTTQPASHVRPKAKPTPKPKPAPTARPTPAAEPRRVVRLGIAAVQTGSWLEVRRGSEHGRVLFSGVLEPGRTLHFEGTRVWARFGAAGNLRITQDGRPVVLQGTYDKLFRPR